MDHNKIIKLLESTDTKNHNLALTLIQQMQIDVFVKFLTKLLNYAIDNANSTFLVKASIIIPLGNDYSLRFNTEKHKYFQTVHLYQKEAVKSTIYFNNGDIKQNGSRTVNKILNQLCKE